MFHGMKVLLVRIEFLMLDYMDEIVTYITNRCIVLLLCTQVVRVTGALRGV